MSSRREIAQRLRTVRLGAGGIASTALLVVSLAALLSGDKSPTPTEPVPAPVSGPAPELPLERKLATVPSSTLEPGLAFEAFAPAPPAPPPVPLANEDRPIFAVNPETLRCVPARTLVLPPGTPLALCAAPRPSLCVDFDFGPLGQLATGSNSLRFCDSPRNNP